MERTPGVVESIVPFVGIFCGWMMFFFMTIFTHWAPKPLRVDGKDRDSMDGDSVCCICLVHAPRPDLIPWACKHAVFCSECIATYMNTGKKSCPLCRCSASAGSAISGKHLCCAIAISILSGMFFTLLTFLASSDGARCKAELLDSKFDYYALCRSFHDSFVGLFGK